jgi:hypothetical protein
LPGQEAVQHRIDFSAEMAVDPHSAFFKVATKRFGDGGAKQNTDPQLGDAGRQPINRTQNQGAFLSLHEFSPFPGHDEQTGRRIEDR